MKPSALRSGDQIRRIEQVTVTPINLIFIRRVPISHGRPAHNVLRSEVYKDLNGPDDEGLCTVSDYDLSRKFELCHRANRAK